MTGVSVKLEKVGIDTTLEGLVGTKTTHYKILSEFTITPYTQPVTMHLVTEIWAADLPFKVVNPWDETLREVNVQDNLKLLHLQQLAVRKEIPGTAVKVVNTMPMGGPLGNVYGRGADPNAPPVVSDSSGPMQTQMVRVYDIKPIDVAASEFAAPTGFTLTGGRGRNGGGGRGTDTVPFTRVEKK